MENHAGNRFGGDEICSFCEQPHTDANYVATDADGVSGCGDCWDAALGVTVMVRCHFAAGAHHCACGGDLRQEPWFAVERTQAQTAHCKACCLEFWGLASADFIVSAIEDSVTTRWSRARGAHLRSSMAETPNDDTSPCISPLAGLSDRGFYTPSLLEGCMNVTPALGEPAALTCDAHTYA